MCERIGVALGARSYEILVGERVLAKAGEHIAGVFSGKRAIIVTDEQVARFYLHRLTGALEAVGIGAKAIILPPGEQTKSFARFEELVEGILALKPDRGTMLVALGGGVIGDITGFAASVVLRGISFIQMPTTLLAQVDSAVGGKTAINSKQGKNLIGSFHQPALVLSDVGVLKTLPQRELLAGYAEVVKYGFINNPAFFDWLEQHATAMLAGDAALTTQAVVASCKAKAAIVGEDEREAGARALLNFGHTFAHALEAETGYSERLLHGEAVAIGMVLAFAASVRMGICAPDVLARVLKHYSAVGLPVRPTDIQPTWNIDALMEHFTRDKKVKDGRLTFVLARGIGEAFMTQEVDASLVKQVLVDYCGGRGV